MYKREKNRRLGSEKEKLAGEYLKRAGYEILEYNFFAKAGEIDLVARDGEYLVFVEVKYRSSSSNGLPEEAVNARKIQRITRAAQYYLMKRGYDQETPCRFDVVAIMGDSLHLVKDAFEGGSL